MIVRPADPHASILPPQPKIFGRRGAALAEFALVFPLLLLIFVIMIDFGRAYIVAKAINNAVAQGGLRASTLAPAGMTSTQWAAAVELTVRQSLADYPWYEAQRLTVTVPIPSNANGLVDGQGVRSVEVRARYQANHVLNLPGLPSGYLIDRFVRMDQLR